MTRTIAPPVPLSNWNIIPSIDFISILVPPDEIERALLLPESISKRVKVPRVSRNIVLTLHDPEASELQALINAWPNAEIHKLEFTLDFHQVCDPGSAVLNRDLFHWLSDCLVPAYPNSNQLHFKENPYPQRRLLCKEGKYVKMEKPDASSETTRKWENGDQYIKNRLYIKEDKWKGQVTEWVRLEATLNRGGCQEKGIQLIWQLVPFAADTRRNLAPYFNIASGIKTPLRRVDRLTEGTVRHLATLKANEEAVDAAARGWATRGAMWAAEQGLKTTPHREANARIGKALDRLKIKLSPLKLPNYSPLVCYEYGQKPVKNQRLRS